MSGNTATLPIAIAGAGIAGLSAAIALTLEGVPVQLFEQATELTAIGAGIQLGPNATQLLARWGVELPSSAYEPEAIELRNASTGKLLNAIPLGDMARHRYGSTYITILRADLQDALLNRARTLGLSIKLGYPINRARERRESVVLSAASGDIEVPALIAADGVHSALRACVPGSRRAVYTHTTAWRALIPARAFPAPTRQVVTLWMGSAAHMVHYPVDGGRSLNAVLAIEDGGSFGASTAGQRKTHVEILPRLKGWTRAAAAVIEAGGEWQAWPLYEVQPGGESGGRRIQLIGDAWHAMRPYLASGGAMAIEDAAALARAFREARNFIPRALYLFRLERTRRIRLVASQSQRMGRIYHLPRPFATARDTAILARSGTALLKRNDWLYATKL